jgi:hypothetical protein
MSGALEQAVEIVGRGRTDEDFEGVNRALAAVSAAGGVGCGGAQRGLQDGTFVVTDEEADRGRFAVAVPHAKV